MKRNKTKGATWRRLGEFIEECDERNTALSLGLDSVMGMNLDKEVIPTKANLKGNDLSSFKIVHPEEFIYNPRTHGRRIGLGYNDGNGDFLISWNNAAFRVKDKNRILPLYLYLNFLRSEWDREACYQSWGSSTEVFSWKALCRMSIPVPSLEVQRKVVAAWRGLRKMKEENEGLVEPLLALCRSYLQECKQKYPMKVIGPLITPCDKRNTDGKYEVDSVRGVSNENVFIETRANMDGVLLQNYKLIPNGGFAYNPSRLNIGSIAHNDSGKTYIVSGIYEAFIVTSPKELLPEFLFLYFRRPEFLRHVAFNSWGSVRDSFSFSEMCRVKIPLPPIEVQQAIVDVYRCANEAKRIAAEADSLSREICPALVRWAAEGGGE